MYWFTVPVHHVVLEVLEVQRVLQVPTFSKGKKSRLNNVGPGEGLIIGENNCITDWMVIFQVDSTLHLLNN